MLFRFGTVVHAINHFSGDKAARFLDPQKKNHLLPLPITLAPHIARFNSY